MSVWTELQGTLGTHKDDHFSLKNYIENYFETKSGIECTKPQIKTDNFSSSHITHFDFSICESGLEAAKVIEDVFEGLPKGASLDCNVKLRWLK